MIIQRSMIIRGNALSAKCIWSQSIRIKQRVKMIPGMNIPDNGKINSLKNSTAIIYTCPMHPEIKQDKPGSCPKCGMDLVPEKPKDSDEEEKAYHNMVAKFQVAL